MVASLLTGDLQCSRMNAQSLVHLVTVVSTELINTTIAPRLPTFQITKYAQEVRTEYAPLCILQTAVFRF
jgi:hypothetical protein